MLEKLLSRVVIGLGVGTIRGLTMPVLGGLLFAVQMMFAVHAVRSGKEYFWIYIILLVPALGCAVYFFSQVLPGLGRNQAIQKAGHTLIKAVDPERELRRRKQELELADTLENRSKLAEECLQANFYAEAIGLFESCLQGMHENDPQLMLKLSEAYFKSNKFIQAKLCMDRLIEKNPDFKSHDGHLLYAKTLSALDLREEALKEYSILTDVYPGEEARVRFGLLLQKMGEPEKAKSVFQESVMRAGLAPKYYRKKEKTWVRIAQDNLN